MPLFIPQLKYTQSTDTFHTVVLAGSIPKQPICLESYTVHLTAAQSNLRSLWVKLPFLNMFDVNTNFPQSNAFPLAVHGSQSITSTTSNESPAVVTSGSSSENHLCNYNFNLSRSVPESFEFVIYDQDGNIYNTQDYTIDLVFSYRRQDLI